MQIQTNTDRNITGSEGLAAQAQTIVEGALARFSDQITSTTLLDCEFRPKSSE
jgi:hypothetical protein